MLLQQYCLLPIAIQANNNNNGNNNAKVATVARGRPKVAKAHYTSFNPDSSDEEEEKDADANDGGTIQFLVMEELKRYQACKGIKLRADEGGYLCSLDWWKKHHKSYPTNVWQLAQKILAIPATSAPSERMFSAAAHVVNKKRVNKKRDRLDPDNVNLLMFLRGNKTFVEWGDET